MLDLGWALLGQPRPLSAYAVLHRRFAAEATPPRTYDVEDARAFLVNTGVDVDRLAREVAGRVGAAFVRATKPAKSSPRPMVKSSSRSCGCADDCCA